MYHFSFGFTNRHEIMLSILRPFHFLMPLY